MARERELYGNGEAVRDIPSVLTEMGSTVHRADPEETYGAGPGLESRERRDGGVCVHVDRLRSVSTGVHSPLREPMMRQPPHRPRLVAIAPGHNVWDERVLRTLDAARRQHECILGLDRELVASTSADELARSRARLGDAVEIISLPHWPHARGVARFTRGLYARRIARQVEALSPDVLHIHESGILGLMVAERVRRRMPHARIIFDYHDWIPYEIANYVRQAKVPYRIATKLWMPRLRRMARAVDVAVCISPGHEQWTREALGIRRTIVVQNVRSVRSALPLGRADARQELVWVGHVMRIRRLELLVDVLARLRRDGVDAVLSLFGEVTEPGYAQELQERARDRGVAHWVAFHGHYRSDAELAGRLGPGAIGLHPGHPDPADTGISQITSSNKFFTYLALGLPVLMDASFENMLALAGEAGVAFDGPGACAAAARRIWQEPGAWQRMSEVARGLQQVWNSEAALARLDDMYAEGGTPATCGLAAPSLATDRVER